MWIQSSLSIFSRKSLFSMTHLTFFFIQRFFLIFYYTYKLQKCSKTKIIIRHANLFIHFSILSLQNWLKNIKKTFSAWPHSIIILDFFVLCLRYVCEFSFTLHCRSNNYRYCIRIDGGENNSIIFYNKT